MIKKYLAIFTITSLLISCNFKNIFFIESEEQEIERKYSKTIDRISSNNFERNLILKAEAVYPSRDSVLVYIPSRLKQTIPNTNLWFFEVVDGVLIPFAITSEAISYYEYLIDSLSANSEDNLFITANFEYRVEIVFKESYTFEEKNIITEEPIHFVSFEKVYVVDMSLKWENYCGSLCGLWISHKRTVIFDELGNLLNVFYDGPIPIAVS